VSAIHWNIRNAFFHRVALKNFILGTAFAPLALIGLFSTLIFAEIWWDNFFQIAVRCYGKPILLFRTAKSEVHRGIAAAFIT
jgi:hypothetical protein